MKCPSGHYFPSPRPDLTSQHRTEPDARAESPRRLSTSSLAPEGEKSLYFLIADSATELHTDIDLEAMNFLEIVRCGLPFSALENLVRAMQVPQKEIASAVNLSATTLGRRKKSGRFTQLESDQIVRIARLFCLARELMAGDSVAARQWLTMPQDVLGDETPLHHASTEVGGREVERLIGQIRHGVFS